MFCNFINLATILRQDSMQCICFLNSLWNCDLLEIVAILNVALSCHMICIWWCMLRVEHEVFCCNLQGIATLMLGKCYSCLTTPQNTFCYDVRKCWQFQSNFNAFCIFRCCNFNDNLQTTPYIYIHIYTHLYKKSALWH